MLEKSPGEDPDISNFKEFIKSFPRDQPDGLHQESYSPFDL